MSPTPIRVTNDSVIWPARMLEAFRPAELPRQSPQLARRICSYSIDPPQWDRYLSNLLVDDRDGSRVGFPAEVVAELAKLFAINSLPELDASRSEVDGGNANDEWPLAQDPAL